MLKLSWGSYMFFVGIVQTANILVLLPIPAPSHFHCFYPLVEQLLERGHNMTVVTPIHFDNDQINHVDLPGVHKHFPTAWTSLRFKYRFTMMLTIFNITNSFAKGSLTHYNFQKLIHANDTQFDLVMIELYFMDAYLALAKKFDVPVVGLIPQTLPTATSWFSSNPTLFSYIPNMYLPFTNYMPFWQRTVNTIFGLAHILAYEMTSVGFNQEIVDDEFYFLDPSKRDVRSMINDISLTLINSHYTLGYPRPFLPNMVEVAGIHMKGLKPLPKNIQDFMDKATGGVVFISFGTMVDPAVVNDWTKVIVEVFEKLPVSVIWKWKPELVPKVSKNFLVQEWFPQNDILNHHNCKLFITHGGIHSIIETVNAAVPVIGLPFFSEQSYNIKMMENLGVGLMLSDIEKYELESAVNRVLNNSSFQQNMNKRSHLFKDRLVDPVSTSVFWIEHVIRHGGGAHMKSSAVSLKWYQYYLIDVFSFLLLLLIILLYTLYVFTTKLLSFFKRVSAYTQQWISLSTISEKKTN